MVETVLKRFRTPAPSEKAKAKDGKIHELQENIPQDVILEAAAKLEEQEGGRGELGLTPEQISTAIDAGLGEELRRRRAELVAKVPLPGA